MKSTRSRMSKIAFATLLAIGSSSANAAGFAIAEQSVTGLGNAFAGNSAGAENASTIFSNPAGMTELTGVNYELGVHLIRPNAEFNDSGSTNTLAGGANLDVNNNDGGNAGTLGIVPNFYYSRDLGNKWTVGLGINAPFGLTTDYDDGWVGRYYGVTSELKTVNVNPSVAYKVSDTFSAGFGLSLQYIEARLTGAIDYGSFFAATALATTPQQADGEAVTAGDDISFGYNFGFMWKPSAQTRIGLAYRSRIKHKLEGDVEYTAPNSAIAGAAQTNLNHVNGSDIESSIELPDSLSIGFHHQVNSKLAIMGDFTRTGWDSVEELRIEFESGAGDAVNTLNWKDSNRYSLGMTYKHSDAWTWRAGVAFDEATNTEETELSVRVPDADRTWLTLGFTYTPSKNMAFDVGYAHLFIDDAEINQVDTGAVGDENRGRGTLVGEYDIDVNILSAQARWLF